MKRRNFIGSLFAAGGVYKKSQPIFLGKDVAPTETVAALGLQQMITKGTVTPEELRPQLVAHISSADLLIALKRNKNYGY